MKEKIVGGEVVPPASPATPHLCLSPLPTSTSLITSFLLSPSQFEIQTLGFYLSWLPPLSRSTHDNSNLTVTTAPSLPHPLFRSPSSFDPLTLSIPFCLVATHHHLAT